MATSTKKASPKKMQKGGPTPLSIRMTDKPMTNKEERQSKKATKATMRSVRKNGSGLKMQTGGTMTKSQQQTSARKAALADSTTKFPYKSSSGAMYATRKDLAEGRPTNPAKIKKPVGKMQAGGSSNSIQRELKTANNVVDTYFRKPINEFLYGKPKPKAKPVASKSTTKKSVGKMQAGGSASTDPEGQATLRSWNAALGLRDSDAEIANKKKVAANSAKVRANANKVKANTSKLKTKKSGGATSMTGYKKQMGGTTSKTTIDPLGKNPGSCKSGKCAPGMRGTKGMGRAKSNFSKKKYKL